MKLKELLITRDKWTQHVGARDKFSDHVSSESERAICWCLTGAIHKLFHTPNHREEIYKKLAQIIEPNYREEAFSVVVNWNDNPERTFEDIENLLTQLDI